MKTRMDFRLEEETKKLVEFAANVSQMTVSGYMNNLVNRCKDMILDDIGDGFAEITMMHDLMELGVLDHQDLTEIHMLVRKKFIWQMIKEDESHIYLENFMAKKDWWQKRIKEFVADYIKEKKEKVIDR